MPNDATVKQHLEARLAQLLRRVRTIEGDLRSPHDRDWPERANELENDEVLEHLDEISLREVTSIREALRRIEEGHYGVCAACGQSVGAARLAAVPTALTCVRCTPP